MTEPFSIWSELVGHRRAFIIAEGADAHYGSMERAREMIAAAHEAGADAIKFQHHIPDAEMLPDIPRSANMEIPLYEFLKKNALTIDQHVELHACAQAVGIEYLCTPFSLTAALELREALPLRAYKIGSGELTDIPTLEAIASFGLPMIVSTGMATVEEIDATYTALMRLDVSLVLMNCTSAYPPRLDDINLGFIPLMAQRYPGAVVGHSDHTPGITTSVGAIALGARVIEKHVTTDATLRGPDADVSITFDQLAELVDAAHTLYQAASSDKTVRESEVEIRAWARRSLVYLESFPAGHVISTGDLWGKRPGTGVPSARLGEFIGRTLTRPVTGNTLLSEQDFQ